MHGASVKQIVPDLWTLQGPGHTAFLDHAGLSLFHTQQGHLCYCHFAFAADGIFKTYPMGWLTFALAGDAALLGPTGVEGLEVGGAIRELTASGSSSSRLGGRITR